MRACRQTEGSLKVKPALFSSSLNPFVIDLLHYPVTFFRRCRRKVKVLLFT